MDGYSHLVVGIPHANGQAANAAQWERDPQVTAARDRWTDWFTDELFGQKMGGVYLVTDAPCRFDCDVERLEGEPDLLCRHRLIDGCAVTSQETNRSLAAWFLYRAHLMEAASRGVAPLIIDAHSFPSDLAPEVDVCIGVNDDASCPPDEVLDLTARTFEDVGYRVSFNHPYGNAIAPVGYAGHSLMIELNKRCYMDERTLRKTAGATRIATILRGLYAQLLRPSATARRKDDTLRKENPQP